MAIKDEISYKSITYRSDKVFHKFLLIYVPTNMTKFVRKTSFRLLRRFLCLQKSCLEEVKTCSSAYFDQWPDLSDDVVHKSLSHLLLAPQSTNRTVSAKSLT